MSGDILDSWKRSVNRELNWNPDRHHKICDRHFQMRFILVGGRGRKVLSKNVVPTLHLDESDDEDTGNIDSCVMIT